MQGDIKMSRCKSCGEEILWGRLTGSDRRIPLDVPGPQTAGNIVRVGAARDSGGPVIRYATKADPAPAGAETYISHHATCPDADSWRQRSRGESPPRPRR